MKKIFEKRQIRLKENEINIQSDSFDNGGKEVNVDPISSQAGSPNLASDVNSAKSKVPNANTYVFNPTTYADKNKSSEVTKINIDAKDGIDLSNTLNKAMKSNPQVAAAVDKGNAVVKAELTSECINFTKKELDNFFKKL